MNDNQNLPINVDSDHAVGTITYANEVIAIIAGMAMYEVEGVVNAAGVTTGGIADLFGRAKPMTRGVKVEVGTEEASVDLVLTVEYGQPIQKVCVEVQENVRKAIETMTGLHVVKVDIHVTGISFEKEAQEMEAGYVKATETVAINGDDDDDDIDDVDIADVDSPPVGIDPDELPVRNIHMGDARMEDEAEEESARMHDKSDAQDDEGE